ncbi:MAG: glycosyltransferase family 4 protein [Candidatus Odinarchaeota archaeon]
MIKVGMLTPFFTGQLGGPYNVITEIVPYLKDMGVSTKIFTTSAIEKFGRKRTEFYEEKNENFQIYRLDSFLRFREYRISFSLLPFLLRNEKSIDIIHSHALRSYQEDMGAIFSLLKKKPLIISPHGGININWDYGDKIPKMISDKSIGYIKRRISNIHYISVSKMEIPLIKKYGKISEQNIHYIPHGVNTEIFKPVNSNNLKKKLGLENYDVILYVGRIAKGKGVDKLIKILNLIHKKSKRVKLVIIGGNAGYLHVVNELIQKYNLSKHVLYLGYIPKENLPVYYSMADLVVYPSRQEIFGLVLCEAMACGKAVIGSNIMGPSEIIIDGETGYTSDFNNIEDLCEKIIHLLDDKILLNQMGKNGLARVKSKFTWKKAAESHYELYKKVLS